MWISIIIISIIGTLLHFLYDISNHNKFIAIIASVNESTWEHIKIALTPMLLWGLFDGFKYGNLDNYFIAKGISLLAVILVIPIIFYSYRVITKKAILFIDIAIFYIAIIIGQILFYYIISLNPFSFIFKYLGIVLLFTIFSIYMIGTLLPLKGIIFKDPLTDKYGIDGHSRVKISKEH